MTGATVEQYVDEAVRFEPNPCRVARPRSLRIARTLLSCRAAVALLNELGLLEDSDSCYRFVNVHNPHCPLKFDRTANRWHCDAALDEHPACGLSWAGATLLCDRLGARLPTGAEWECLASNNDPQRVYPWGDEEPSPQRANYDEHYGGTTEVHRFPPTELGLYDVAGNLGEWCQDAPAPEAGRPGAFERLVKGGAWSKDARYLRIRASRGKWARLGTTTIGVRPVWEDGG